MSIMTTLSRTAPGPAFPPSSSQMFSAANSESTPGTTLPTILTSPTVSLLSLTVTIGPTSITEVDTLLTISRLTTDVVAKTPLARFSLLKWPSVPTLEPQF